jgi:S-adenosylmethionine:tRNA ribosyltransferase-isomerase
VDAARTHHETGEATAAAPAVLTSDYDYELPPALIAQTPAEPRDTASLLVLERETGRRVHAHFREIGRFLHAGDLLVLNDTRVLNARLGGHRVPTGGRVEALLVREREPGLWEALLRPGRPMRPGQQVRFEAHGESILARVEDWLNDGICLLRFDDEAQPERLGSVPLPPYIHRRVDDPERYQTVYAREKGSAAAPTAGFHFTPELLDSLRSAGIETVFLTLHVGPGTFRPVHVEDARRHPMHAEFYRLSEQTAGVLNRARQERRRIVAVGTTSVRVLEHIAQEANGRELEPGEGWTRLLILPGHRFRMVDALITNFHLPRSTLLMLIAALAGRELVLATYAEAVRLGYRFYSFGDAMLIT